MRKITWNLPDDIFFVKTLLSELDLNGVLCIEDKIQIEIKLNGNYRVTYETHDNNELTNKEIANLMSHLGFVGGYEE